MVKEFTATYRRVFRTKQYESETIELSVTLDAEPTGASEGTHAVSEVASLYKDLARIGDRIMAKRLGNPTKTMKMKAKTTS